MILDYFCLIPGKAPSGETGNEDMGKFLGTRYNVWNTCINIIYPYKYKLGKDKQFLFDNVCCAIEHIK